MTTTTACTMPDVQSQNDPRGIAIDKVGVNELRYPITVLDPQSGKQNVAATISMSVSLPHHFKGTHMSRFIEVLNEFRGELTMRTIPSLLGRLRERLNAECAHIEVGFVYFLERAAPVTGACGLMDYQCQFRGESDSCRSDFVLEVTVPVASLCPCSREISDYGAHNQRGHVKIEVRTAPNAEVIWIEDLIAIAERSASAPVYPLLKRADERFVTMQAYDNPAFVEDIARTVSAQLIADPRVAWFRVGVVNFESIHNHNAFANISWTRPA